MAKGKLSKPELVFENHPPWSPKLLGLIAGMILILGVFGVWVIASHQHSSVSTRTSSSTKDSSVDSSIKIQFETIQPDGTGENYFVNYRLKREQFRQDTKAMLAELLDSSVEKTKIQAQEKWLELSTKIQSEDEIENLLKIKGFKDVVVDANPDNVTLVVYAPGLSSSEVSQIQTIVVRVTKVRLDKIMISVKK